MTQSKFHTLMNHLKRRLKRTVALQLRLFSMNVIICKVYSSSLTRCFFVIFKIKCNIFRCLIFLAFPRDRILVKDHLYLSARYNNNQRKIYYSLFFFSYLDNSLSLSNVIVFTHSSGKSFSASIITQATTVAIYQEP